MTATMPAWRPGTDPALLRCPCELGACGWCSDGKHDRCAWERGTTLPVAREHTVSITDRRGRCLYLPGHGPAEVHVPGGHTWTCACHREGHGFDYHREGHGFDYHREGHGFDYHREPVQLALFGEVIA